MAEFIVKEGFSTLEGTSVRSGIECLYARYTDSAIEIIKPYKILDVLGSGDGANSVVFTEHYPTGAKTENRVTETTNELKEAFAKAGIHIPPAEKSLGRHVRALQHSLRVPAIF